MAETNDPKSQILNDFNKSLNLDTSENIEVGKFDPTPNSLDYLKKYTGNPITGSNPQLKGGVDAVNDYSSNLTNFLAKSTQAKADTDYTIMKPFTYNGDYDGANFERYYNTKQFDKLGFSPYRDNESLYNQNRTLGDDFVRAATQWPSLVMTGMKSGVESWGDMFSDPLAPDLENSRRMAKAMAVGSSSKKGVGAFGINTALNMGYTVGIGAELLGEELLLAAATVLSGGTAAEGTIPAMMARAVGAADKVRDAGKIANETIGATQAIKGVDQLRTFWNTNKVGKAMASAGAIINPLENTWNVAKDVVRGTNSIGHVSNYARHVGNFGEFAKDMIMIKTAVSEAKLEGGSAQIDITGKLIEDYRTKNGKDPEGLDLAKIESQAKEEAYRTAFWNMPAIMWSNKFMYETIFKPFEKGASKAMQDIAFNEARGEFAGVGTTLAEKAAATGKSLANPKTYLDFTRNYMKANLAEGIQENLQEAIASGAASHARAVLKDPSRASYETYMGHFLHGMNEQFSAQGAETFAGGFLMGSMAQPVMTGPMKIGKFVKDNTWGKEKFQEAKKTQDEQTARTVETLNNMYKDPAKYFAPELKNMSVNTKLANDLYSAHKANDKKATEDIKDASIFENIYTAAQTGHLDTFVDKFKEYQKMSPEELSEAFMGVKDAKLGMQAQDMLSKVIGRIQEIGNRIDEVNSTYPNPFINNPYDKSTPEYVAHEVSKEAWTEAQKNMVFAQHSFELHSDRIQKIADALTSTSAPLKNVNSQDMMVLLDNNLLKQHVLTLQEEIKYMDTTGKVGRQEKANKTKKIEILNKFSDALENGENIDKHITHYIKHLAKSINSFSLDDKLRNAIDLIKDNHALKDEQENLVRSINVMHNPKAFFNIHRRMAQILKDELDRSAKTTEEHVVSTNKAVQTNQALNDLTGHLGLRLNSQYLNEFFDVVKANKEFTKDPDIFIDVKTGEKVTEGPRFEEALKYWNAHKSLVIGEWQEPGPKEATTSVIVPNQPLVKVTDKTKWADLPKVIQDVLEPYYQEFNTDSPMNHDEFLDFGDNRKSPVYINAVKDYNGESTIEIKSKVLAPQFKGKFIYVTPGAGKSTFAKQHKDVVDTDTLIVDEILKIHPEFTRNENEDDNDFIFRYVKTYGATKAEINSKVLAQVRAALLEGKTVLTGTLDFAKDVDIAFGASGSRVEKRFNTAGALDQFQYRERSRPDMGKKLIEIGENNIEDILTGTVSLQPETNQQTVVNNIINQIDSIPNMLEYDKEEYDIILSMSELLGSKDGYADVDMLDNILLDKKASLLENLNKETLTWLKNKKIPVTLNKGENTDLSVQYAILSVSPTNIVLKSRTERITVPMSNIFDIKVYKESTKLPISSEAKETAKENVDNRNDIVKEVISKEEDQVDKTREQLRNDIKNDIC